MKRVFRSALAVMGLAVSAVYVFGDAAPANIVSYVGTGVNHNTPVYTLDYTGTQQQAGDLSLGMKGTAANTLPTLGDASLQIPVYLSTNSATAAVQGSVILATAPFNGQVTGIVSPANAVAGNTTVLGIADVAAATGTVFQLDIIGTSLVLGTGTITTGDLLVSSGTSAGYAGTNNSAAAGAIIGTALNSGTSAAPGLIEVLLHH